MRFDDTLETVLAGDLGTPFGKQSAWRQLVDLIGRRRVPPDTRALALLRHIRAEVPPPVRQASARGLEHANPPAPLVRIFALDDIPIALPVLRSARLNSADWIQLLPDLAPPARAILRNRRDLSPVVRRALESYGPTDFVLPDKSLRVAAPAAEQEPEPEPETAQAELEAFVPESLEPEAVEPAGETAPEIVLPCGPGSRVGESPAAVESPAPEPAAPATPLPPEQLVDWTAVLAAPSPMPPAPADPAATAPAPAATTEDPAAPSANAPPANAPVAAAESPLPETEDLSFVALAGMAAALSNDTIVAPPEPATPGIGPAPVQSGTIDARSVPEPIAEAVEPAQESPMASLDTLLDKSLATPEPIAGIESEPEGPFEIADVVARIDAFWRHREEGGPETAPRAPAPAEHFRFETDAQGVIRWVEGVSRTAIVGLSLDFPAGPGGGTQVDGVAAGAFRRRAGFSNARLEVDGESDAGGAWLISAIPVFDPAIGRFTGYRGTARRPRADERAEPVRPQPNAADSLRQLVHELRTPTNAIAGFAEMIETQMLGPVSHPYRERANVIRAQARELLGAIDDLDLAARIDSHALALVPGPLSLRPVLAAIADDLAPLAALRGSWIALPVGDLAVTGDRRAVERLLARLMATLVSASGPDERIGVRSAAEADNLVAITIDRPAALSDYPGDTVLGIDDEGGDAALLGTGFALRLARNLARELGGSLVIEAESLTLRLPAAENLPVDQAHLS